MLSCQKEQFQLDPTGHYINCAYMSPLLNRQEKVAQTMLQRLRDPRQVKAIDFFQPVEDLKKAFAQLIHAEHFNRIAVFPAASYGMSTVARNIHPKKGENMVLLEEQFPSNYYCWERLAKEHDTELRIIKAPPVGEGRVQIWNQQLLDAIDVNTVAVCMGCIHWADGTLFDLKAIREKTKAVAALLILDGSQTVGALPMDVSDLQPDALICAGYKWLFAPYGISMGYFGPAFDGGIPLEETWINRERSEDFSGLVHYESNYRPMAWRYSMGEQGNLLQIPMTTSGIQQILDWGVENIQAYCEHLFAPYLDQFRTLGCQIEEDAYRCKHLFGIRLGEDFDKNALKVALEKHQVSVSFRGDAVRLSPHVYNDARDVEVVLECFHEAKNK